MTQDEIKYNFSKNLSTLRKANNLTQAMLAQKLNYTDKAVSKWEVGSVLPDIETIAHIAEFFGITINDLVYPKKEKWTSRFLKNHLFITLGSVGVVWFLASIIFFVLDATESVTRSWLVFIIAIPIMFIVFLIFSILWFKKLYRILAISGLLWGMLTVIYLAIANYGLWFIFIIGVVGQLMICFLAQINTTNIIRQK